MSDKTTITISRGVHKRLREIQLNIAEDDQPLPSMEDVILKLLNNHKKYVKLCEGLDHDIKLIEEDNDD